MCCKVFGLWLYVFFHSVSVAAVIIYILDDLGYIITGVQILQNIEQKFTVKIANAEDMLVCQTQGIDKISNCILLWCSDVLVNKAKHIFVGLFVFCWASAYQSNTNNLLIWGVMSLSTYTSTGHIGTGSFVGRGNHSWSMFYTVNWGHGGRVVTLSPPTSEAGVRFPARPQVGKLVVACRWSAFYSAEP